MKFSWPVRVYYEDTDSGSVVYYANYLKFYERARTEYLRELEIQQDSLITDQNIIFAVRKMDVDYIKPAVFNDALEVTAEISDLKKASVVFRQTILRHGQVLNQASCKIACLAADTMKPVKLPAFIYNKLAQSLSASAENDNNKGANCDS